ncbi:hypothetical protein A5886_000354 [Enterococcus sp. 8G7_MSG3316]|uniref:Uncharacterized protein n=1 Tax=Candidatus Enterococcus testudinis TaxID=1834191 RepID=A0A242A2N0_9ENTE|nr:hypothetical protein [Enterococcus sp. 8G7_MSG3316]OTN75284.1 hypothetical protein A5886_000354 [Enterococcus sp. 8G7_MSG3316]
MHPIYQMQRLLYFQLIDEIKQQTGEMICTTDELKRFKRTQPERYKAINEKVQATHTNQTINKKFEELDEQLLRQIRGAGLDSRPTVSMATQHLDPIIERTNKHEDKTKKDTRS